MAQIHISDYFISCLTEKLYSLVILSIFSKEGPVYTYRQYWPVLPCRLWWYWSCSDTHAPRTWARSTAARGCSRFLAPGNCHWLDCWVGTLLHCVTRVHGTRNVSPSCSLGWCSCLAPNLVHSWSELHSTHHSGYNQGLAAFHLARKSSEKRRC